jgi:hypothetical protein
MRQIIIISLLVIMGLTGLTFTGINTPDESDKKNTLEPMEALDLVKEVYAGNFTKNSLQENPKDYFYKLDNADYYLVYEDTDKDSGYYLFHLYEFVLDDIDEGIGHTVTYGWYWVDPYTGDIWEYQ